MIKADAAVAFVTGALSDRAAAYTALGRTEEAASDTRRQTQLANLVGTLAAP